MPAEETIFPSDRQGGIFMSARKLAYCAICIALAFILSLIRIFTFPFGGDITLCSLLFVVLPAWLFGVPSGVICGLLYGMLVFFISPYYVSFTQFLFDYVLAFSVMGLAGLFRNADNGLVKGYALAVFLRWVMATIAGIIWVSLGMTAWDGWHPLPYSMAYNAAYIFSEALATVILLMIPAVRKPLERVKSIANR